MPITRHRHVGSVPRRLLLVGALVALGVSGVCPYVLWPHTALADATADEKADEGSDAGADGQTDEGSDATADEKADESADESAAGTPREVYNAALLKLQSGDLDGAETTLLEARGEAGQDHDLRYRAAFNLGIAYAAKADKAAPAPAENPEQAEAAVSLLRQSAAWFRDAARVRPDDEDARVNLELVLLRIQQLADIINRGENSLEKRLDRLIEEERALRDRVRALLARVDDAGASAEPLAFREDYRGAASAQRTHLTDLNALLDVSGDERSQIDSVPEEERTDEQRLRLAQLTAFEHYLERAQGAMADGRRSLRKLSGELAHRRVDAAVRALHRAREQLHDPIAVLKSVLADELNIREQSVVLGLLRKGRLRLEDDAVAKAPAWLTAAYLTEQEGDNLERALELQYRLDAGIKAAQDGQAMASDAAADPQQAQLLLAIEEALPFIQVATAAMGQARSALEADTLEEAAVAHERAIEALNQAIERFAALRDLIELVYAEQLQTVLLLDPQRAAEEAPQLADLDEGQRTELIRKGVQHNRDRLARLQGLLQDELAKVEQQAQAAAAQGQAPTGQDQDPLEFERERFRLAEEHRRAAFDALVSLQQTLDQMASSVLQTPSALTPQSEDGPQEPDSASAAAGSHATAQADEAARAYEARARHDAGRSLERVEELRLLFLSTVEHLKELARRQAETMDETSSIDATLPDDGTDSRREARMTQAGPLAQTQSQHEQVATALVDALRKQADAAAAQADPAAGGQDASQALSAAADEVVAAASTMRSATGTLSQSPLEVSVAVESQRSALQHLVAAIALLEEQQQPPQDQNEEQKQDEELSKSEAERKLQQVREREAERRRDRAREPGNPEPVEKDW